MLAVPLLLYFVGVPNAHIAIGTSAVGVSLNAAANLVGHARRGSVRWPCAIAFTLAGIVGAAIGSTIGKLIDPQPLTLLFAIAMVAVAGSMWRPRHGAESANVHLTPQIAMRLIPIGLGVGLASGFFGIGGGFLIVPAGGGGVRSDDRSQLRTFRIGDLAHRRLDARWRPGWRRHRRMGQSQTGRAARASATALRDLCPCRCSLCGMASVRPQLTGAALRKEMLAAPVDSGAASAWRSVQSSERCFMPAVSATTPCHQLGSWRDGQHGASEVSHSRPARAGLRLTFQCEIHEDQVNCRKYNEQREKDWPNVWATNGLACEKLKAKHCFEPNNCCDANIPWKQLGVFRRH